MIAHLQNASLSAGQSSKAVQSLLKYFMYKDRKLGSFLENDLRNKIQKYVMERKKF